MMTVAIEQYETDKYYVEIAIENRYGNNIYVVQICHRFDSGLCGFPINKMVYSIDEKKKAYATYRRYIRKYCK